MGGMNKICKICGSVLNSNKRGAAGCVGLVCWPCYTQDQKEWRKSALGQKANREACQKSRQKHPDVSAAAVRRYQLRKGQRCPKWLDEAQHAQILEFYTKCAQLNIGPLQYAVDHIVPLYGEKVSGLHVPWNLQILTRSENSSKGNRYEVL